jgi:hypothetical protein
MFLKFRLLYLVTILWIVPAIFYGQTKSSSESITVDLGSVSFSGTKGLPFDVPFRIEGDATKNLRQVILKYRVVKDETRKWMRFPKKVNTNGACMDYSLPSKWNQIDEYKDDQKFYLQVGPLHPNVKYEFNFELLRTLEVDPTKSSALKQTLLAVIQDYAANIAESNPVKQKNVNDELAAILQKSIPPGAKIKTLDQKDFELDINKAPLAQMMTDVIAQNAFIKNFDDNMKSLYSPFTDNTKRKTLIDPIQNLDITSLDPRSTAVWKAPVSPATEQFKLLKMDDVLGLIIEADKNITTVFLGKGKIEDGKIVPATEFNAASVDLLISFFSKIEGLKNKKNENVFRSMISSTQEAIFGLTSAKTKQEELTKNKKDKSELLSKFPDVLENKLLSFSYVFYDQSNMDVMSEANPYIGLDFGAALIPTYNQFFIYEGVNFYFAPVNKDAPLSRFTSGSFRNLLAKTLSIHMGLTQSLVKVENVRYEPLIADVGSILIGLGIRVNRITRLNAGYMFFFQKDINPLIDHKELTAKLTTSITFDLNIGKALGNFGKRLKFTP